jgi:hypothetical protein
VDVEPDMILLTEGQAVRLPLGAQFAGLTPGCEGAAVLAGRLTA